ncbi:MAG TPA: HipA family kinase [Streptosporangiaceae bacterium]|nr:HipA family kinase [Streptosporangiaceae bacterium]
MLPEVTAITYVTPLREGGSLPAIMEADDCGTYVVKFRGAGQGPKALVAEVISAGLARVCGLRVPDLVTVALDPALASGEPDQEIQDLLRASAGLNLGVDFLSGAVDFDATAPTVDGELAGRIIWFDALVSNADRSWRNPNMLFWRDQLYVIDHGATLTFQHRWESAAAAAARPYDAAQHALIGCDPQIEAADAELAGLISEEVLAGIVAEVPVDWLEPEPAISPDPARIAAEYANQLADRLAARSAWVPSLVDAARQPAARRRARPAPPSWLTRSPRERAANGGAE